MRIVFDESFNWLAVLKDLVAGAPIDDQDWQMLRQKAVDWPTCACGQLCSALPRDWEGKPKDPKLVFSGIKFAGAIEGRNWGLALRLFRRIEQRTEQLLLKQEAA